MGGLKVQIISRGPADEKNVRSVTDCVHQPFFAPAHSVYQNDPEIVRWLHLVGRFTEMPFKRNIRIAHINLSAQILNHCNLDIHYRLIIEGHGNN